MSTRWQRMAPLAGVAFVVLLVAGVLLGWSTPSSSASPAKVLAYYQAHHSRVNLSSYLTGLSLFFGLFWFGYLRSFLRRRPDLERLAAIGFGGGVLFAVGGGLAAGTQFALADKPRAMTASTAQALNLLENDLFVFIVLAGLATVLFAYGLAFLRSRELIPRWVAWVAIAFGVFSLTPVGWLSLFFLAIWSLMLSIALYRRQAPAAESPTAPPAPAGKPAMVS